MILRSVPAGALHKQAEWGFPTRQVWADARALPAQIARQQPPKPRRLRFARSRRPRRQRTAALLWVLVKNRHFQSSSPAPRRGWRTGLPRATSPPIPKANRNLTFARRASLFCSAQPIAHRTSFSSQRFARVHSLYRGATHPAKTVRWWHVHPPG